MVKPAAGGNLDARDLKLLLTGEGPLAELSSLSLGAVGGRIGKLDYRAGDVTFHDLRSPADARAPVGTATDRASASGVELDFGNFQLAADRLEFPSGIRFTGEREVLAPEAHIENLSFTMPNVPAGGGQRDEQSESGPPNSPQADAPKDGPTNAIDFAFLDTIEGHINIDLFVDTTVPLLGRRRATHHFRIPIERGTVDYRGIEDNLHWLEDAFLDIEVIDGKLVLEQDLPFVPFSGKALVWWPLDAKELELARQRRVRLRTLLSPELPPGASNKKKKSSVTFHQGALRNVDVNLSIRREAAIAIGDVARVHLGAGDLPGLVELKVRGDLQHHMRRPLEPTSVEASLHRLTAGDTGLFFKPVTITASGVELGPIHDVKVEFQGISPSSISARLSRATIRDLRVVF